MNDALNRLLRALDMAEALDALEAALNLGLAVIPGMPPLPNKANWQGSTQDHLEHAATLDLSDLQTWATSAIDALDQQEG